MTTVRRLLPGLVLSGLMALAVPVQAAETDKYLPNNAEGVVTINIKQMLQAPLVKNNLEALKAMLTTAGDAPRMMEELGFDPFRDVDSVVIAFAQDPSKPLVLVNGRFDLVKFQARAEKAAKDNADVLKLTKENGHTVFEVKPPDKDEALFVALLDSTLLTASPNKTLVVEALDKKAGTKKSEMKPELQTLLNKANPQQSITVVTLGAPLAAGGQPLAAKISTLVGNINISDEVKAEVVLNTKNVQDAKSVESELKENLDQIKALVELTANQNDKLKPLVDVVGTLKVSAEGNAVTLKGQLVKDVINKLMQRSQ